MLTSDKIIQTEALAGALLGSNKGQGLPQEAKFSELFASIYSAEDGQTSDIDVADMLPPGVKGLTTASLAPSSALSESESLNANNGVVKLLTSQDLLGLVSSVEAMTEDTPGVLGLMNKALSGDQSIALNVLENVASVKPQGYASVSDLSSMGENAKEAKSVLVGTLEAMTEDTSGVLGLMNKALSGDQSIALNVLENVASVKPQGYASVSDLSSMGENSKAVEALTTRPGYSALHVDLAESTTSDYFDDGVLEETPVNLLSDELGDETLGTIDSVLDDSDLAAMPFGAETLQSLRSTRVDNTRAENMQNLHAQTASQATMDEQSELLESEILEAVAPAAVAQTSQTVINPAGNSVTTSLNSNVGSAQNMTQWGSANAEMSQNANAGFGQGQGSQSSPQGGQGQQAFAAQQQMMQVQEQRSKAVEQQMAVKTTEELAKLDSKETLLSGEFSLGDRRGQLPIGLQSIQQPVKHPQWGQALGQRVVFMATNQLQQAQITLNPEKLGPVQVKLHMDKDQQVHVTMTAQHSTTREAMESALPRLREMLEQSGVDLGSVDVSDDNQFAENETQEEQSAHGSTEGAEQDSDTQENSAAVKVASTDNIVDYYA